MKSLIAVISISLLVVLATCGRGSRQAGMGPSAKAELPSPEALHAEVLNFQEQVETSLVYRAKMQEVAERLVAQNNHPLTGRDLETVKSGTRAYLDLRKDLYAVAERYEGLRTGEISRLDPVERLKATSMSLAAALTLYDNYLTAIAVYVENNRLRLLVNDPDSGFGIAANTLTELAESAASISKRQRIRNVMKFYEFERNRLTESGEASRLENDQDWQYLAMLIEQSPSYNFVRQLQVGTISSTHFHLMEAVSSDFLAEMRDGGVNMISLAFGNAVGLYESRKGKLYDDVAVAKELKTNLKPLDILVEKTPFRLTDKFIPGHFGHVAIWLGDEEELRAMGVWEDPAIKPYHSQLTAAAGKDPKDAALIVEALRSGVQLSTLSHFMNVDDVAILRPESVQSDPAARREAVLMAARQLGKEYDFNFDVNTTEKIVCSELAYVAFPTLTWPTANSLGRATISPDQVARQAWEGDPLRLVYFCHDGKPMPSETALATMRALMAKE